MPRQHKPNPVQSYVGKHNYFTYRAKSYAVFLEDLIHSKSTTPKTKYWAVRSRLQLRQIIKELKMRRD